MLERNDFDEISGTSLTKPKKKKFLGIVFACCNVYTRIYVNASGKHYEGRCPSCLRHLSIRIGKGGVKDRFFIAH